MLLVGLAMMSAAGCASPTSNDSGVAQTDTPGSEGYLEGQVTIGPLTPVERADIPAPTPSPQLCKAVGLLILLADGTTEAKRLTLDADCSYRVALDAGTYIVRLNQSGGVQFSKDLPKTVEIQSGRTTQLDFYLDTGIR